MKIQIYYGSNGTHLNDFVFPKNKDYIIKNFHLYFVEINFKRYKSCKTFFLDDSYDKIIFPKIKDLSYLGRADGCNKYMGKLNRISWLIKHEDPG
jgi:hypothetical protein